MSEYSCEISYALPSSPCCLSHSVSFPAAIFSFRHTYTKRSLCLSGGPCITDSCFKSHCWGFMWPWHRGPKVPSPLADLLHCLLSYCNLSHRFNYPYYSIRLSTDTTTVLSWCLSPFSISTSTPKALRKPLSRRKTIRCEKVMKITKMTC